jgi:hypothetical protein
MDALTVREGRRERRKEGKAQNARVVLDLRVVWRVFVELGHLRPAEGQYQSQASGYTRE